MTNNFRPSEPEERIDLLAYLQELGMDVEESRGLIERSFIGVAVNYITDCPGYAGKVMVVLYPGGDNLAVAYGWDSQSGELKEI